MCLVWKFFIWKPVFEKIFMLHCVIATKLSINSLKFKKWLVIEKWLCTLSEIHYERRKTEQVTLKANFIQFWSVESEFIIKNYFLAWTSELACILAFIWKSGLFFGYFWDLQYWPHLVTLLKRKQRESNRLPLSNRRSRTVPYIVGMCKFQETAAADCKCACARDLV